MSALFSTVLRVSSCLLVVAMTMGAENAAGETPAQSSGGKGGKTGTFTHETIAVDGAAREYRLVVPRKINDGTPVPLVFAFHGFLIDSKDLMPMYSLLDFLAEEKGFILAYLNARNHAWPLVLDWAGPDIAFFDKLYGQLVSDYNIDLNRVYLAGMSNGAYFINLLASQRPEKIAAIACHSGGLGFVAFSEMKLKNKYGVMAIHGAKDFIVKVEEGRRIRDAYLKWGHPVRYVEAPKLGHFWATAADVNHKIWDFFMEHPRNVGTER